jgi:hypothetical protein
MMQNGNNCFEHVIDTLQIQRGCMLLQRPRKLK